MIITETVIIRNKEFIHNYSDEGYYIERDGILYADAMDLPENGYVYTETDQLIEIEEEID